MQNDAQEIQKAHRLVSVSLSSATVHHVLSLKYVTYEHNLVFIPLRTKTLKFSKSDAELTLVLGPVFQHRTFGFCLVPSFENDRSRLRRKVTHQKPTAHAPNKPDNPIVLLLVGCGIRRFSNKLATASARFLEICGPGVKSREKISDPRG